MGSTQRREELGNFGWDVLKTKTKQSKHTNKKRNSDVLSEKRKYVLNNQLRIFV